MTLFNKEAELTLISRNFTQIKIILGQGLSGIQSYIACVRSRSQPPALQSKVTKRTIRDQYSKLHLEKKLTTSMKLTRPGNTLPRVNREEILKNSNLTKASKRTTQQLHVCKQRKAKQQNKICWWILSHTYKKKLLPIFLIQFQKSEEEGTYSNSFHGGQHYQLLKEGILQKGEQTIDQHCW